LQKLALVIIVCTANKPAAANCVKVQIISYQAESWKQISLLSHIRLRDENRCRSLVVIIGKKHDTGSAEALMQLISSSKAVQSNLVQTSV